MSGKRVRVGAPDPSLTATSGVSAIGEFLDKLDVVATFYRGIGPLKQRERGATAGELVVRMASNGSRPAAAGGNLLDRVRGTC